MAFGMDMLDLKKQFTFYASYHNQPVNVLIHLLCIWPILATACLMLQYTPAFMATPDWLSSIPSFQHVKINASFVAICIYVACYLVMEPFVGGCATVLLCFILGQTASLVDANTVVLGHPVWKVALAIHITGWILQFIGHGVFEGRAPALLDSLDQAFLTAPLFVFMEVFFFFGYRPSFHAEIMQVVQQNVEEFRKRKAKTN